MAKEMKYCCEKMEEIVDSWVYLLEDIDSNSIITLMGRDGMDDPLIPINYCPFCGKSLKVDTT